MRPMACEAAIFSRDQALNDGARVDGLADQREEVTSGILNFIDVREAGCR